VDIELDDTIAALASAAGPGERGIIRLSGPAVRETLNRCFLADHPQTWSTVRVARRHPGRLRLRDIRLPVAAAAYLWPTAKSYTGQPAAELHLIGSPPLLEAALSELYAHGIRPARPGEFTLRAFLSGRIDLVQAEAVLGVIDAHSHRQLEAALQQLAGGISGRIAAVRDDLIGLLADLEAGLDFVEEDIEFVSVDELLLRMTSARDEIGKLLDEASSRMLSTGRRRVVVAGLPNAGKSTLFNVLLGRDAALVSDDLGTTRDYLSADCDWNGIAVELIDTAGWDCSSDRLALRTQELRSEQLERADLVLWCRPADLNEPQRKHDARLQRELAIGGPRLLAVQTKHDLADAPTNAGELSVCALDGTGLVELVARITRELSTMSTGGQQLLGTISARCQESLESTAESLQRAHAAKCDGAGDEIVAIDIHETLDHLGRILGKVYTDDVLDRIFSQFCIGK
jgi:tRNA modification GTPase